MVFLFLNIFDPSLSKRIHRDIFGQFMIMREKHILARAVEINKKKL